MQINDSSRIVAEHANLNAKYMTTFGQIQASSSHLKKIISINFMRNDRKFYFHEHSAFRINLNPFNYSFFILIGFSLFSFFLIDTNKAGINRSVNNVT